MALSRPLISFAAYYFEQFFNHPVRTQAITGATLDSSAYVIAYSLSKKDKLSIDNVLVYSILGAFIDGPVPYYFHSLLNWSIRQKGPVATALKLLFERLGFTPLYQALILYVLARLERKNHKVACTEVKETYWSFLHANWKYLTPFIWIDLVLVPPMLRIQFLNTITFFWIIYVAFRRRLQQIRKTSNK